MLCSAIQASDYLKKCIRAKVVPMLHGDPGIGKSSLIKEIAEYFNLELIDIRLSTYDPCDLQGFPRITESMATYVPMDTFPILGRDELPTGKNGWLIFFDEFNSASLAVQAAAYKIILDKEVGQLKLHPKVAMVCAGNLATNGAIVNRMSTAMQSRLVHLELTVDPSAWMKWATATNVDHRIMGYLSHRPECLHKFDPKHDDKTFCCPRTWEFVSKLLKNVATADMQDMLVLLAGAIGEATAREFVSYTEIYSRIPSYRDVVKDPMNTDVSTEPAVLFAISHMIGAFLKKSDVDPVMEYLDRLPVEFQTITLQGALARDKSLISERAINRWIATKGAELF